MARGERLDLKAEDRMRGIGTKLVCLVTALCLLFCLVSCGQGSEPEQTAQKHISNEASPSADADNKAEQEDGSAGENKSLVVYFSRTGEQYTVGVISKGNTAIVAEMIAAETGADLLELVPADDYYPMTYAELTDVAKREQRDGARPK